jgi:peptide/nickel transport system ATP-binding protein
MADAKSPLLEISELKVAFDTETATVTPILGVNLAVNAGETVALVGESGSGKSVTSLAVMGLLPRPAGRIAGGEIRFRQRNGAVVDLAGLSFDAMRRLRGGEIAMIFQEPMTSLNPVLSVGEQIAEAVRQHLGLDRRAALKRAVDMLELVEIPAAASRAHEYPHEMSGGMRQRVMIALAMSCNPSLLIADEPTTALDVTVQAQILALIDRLRRETGMGVLFITHNLGVVAQVADRVTVMYAGQVVEAGPVRALFRAASHPYTRGLMDCLPARARTGGNGRRIVKAIPGAVASALAIHDGCRFAPRCGEAAEICREAMPALQAADTDHVTRCVRWRAL